MLCVIKGKSPPSNERKMCPSYTNVDEMVSWEAVGVLPLQVACGFDDVEDIYWAHEIHLMNVLDEYAPVREKTSQNPTNTTYEF